jgi:hypothetical protein
MKTSLPFLGFLDVRDKMFRTFVLRIPAVVFVGSLLLQLLVYRKSVSESMTFAFFVALFVCFVGFVGELFRQKRSQ